MWDKSLHVSVSVHVCRTDGLKHFKSDDFVLAVKFPVLALSSKKNGTRNETTRAHAW